MIINATSSVSLTFTCSWTLDWAGRCRLFCDIGLAFRTENFFYFCFQIFANLHPYLIIRWWSSWWQSDILSWCWSREDRRRVTVTETRQGVGQGHPRVLITVPAQTQPCRLCTRIRSPAPGLREILLPLIGCRTPVEASDWSVSRQDQLQCSLSLGHWTLSPDQTLTNIFPLDPNLVALSILCCQRQISTFQCLLNSLLFKAQRRSLMNKIEPWYIYSSICY